MKLWTVVTSLSLSLLLLSGCGGTPKPADKESVVLDNSLPLIALTKRGTIVGMTSVAFEWGSITNPTVKGVYVYKKMPIAKGKSKLVYYTTIESRFSTHYVDNDVKPDTRYSYFFKAFSEKGEGKPSRVVTVNTLPVLSSVSWIHSITGMPRVAKIIWRPHSNKKVNGYVMERKTLKVDKWQEIGIIKGRLNAEYIDEDLKDNFVYMYRLRALTYDGITSTPSVIVKVVTKALPKSITNLRATRAIANKINLNWDKSVQEGFALYHLYRSKDIKSGYRLIAKLQNNTYSNKIEENGQVYFYKVNAVDTDGLESEDSKASLGMTLSASKAPAIVQAKRIGNTIVIQWSETDTRSVNYTVNRTHKKGWFNEVSKTFAKIKGHQFKDENIEADSTYSYVVYSVDVHGIESKESMRVKIVTPKTMKKAKTHSKSTAKPQVKKQKQVTPSSTTASSDNLDLSGL